MEHIDEMAIPHTLATVESQRAVWLSGPSCMREEVVGEAYNPEQMQRVVAGLQGQLNAALSAWLMPEPNNSHDPNAVVVWVFGGKVGYLPRELASRWGPVLGRLRGRYGVHAACQAAVDPPSQSNRGEFGVVVWLPELPAPQSRAAAPHPSAIAADVSQDSPAPAERPRAALPHAATPEELEQLRADVARVRAELQVAQGELRSVEEALEIQSFGFYQPRYGFVSASEYVVRLKVVRDEQQALIKADGATACATQWKVGGSATEGKKMVRSQSKIMLRAFNGECDAAVAKVKYDNVATMEERITKSCEAINKLGLVQHVSITHRYFGLKLAELRLVHEHREKVQEEKEEQRVVKEQMREEQKAQEELDRAKAQAEKEEAASTAALEKARAELAAVDAAGAAGQQHDRLEALVTRLETELKGALDRKAKAIARAQLTKSGHVYVLSNIGSFGEGVYKIGMTRRFEPLERVDELGDASVPFPFDVHAIIYTEDAPKLEYSLHKAFAHRRVNRVNQRKEYFRVSLDEVRDEVHKLHGLVSFLLIATAEEYRKTCAAAEAGAAALECPPEDVA